MDAYKPCRFIVKFDPGPYPLAPGYEISNIELKYGLETGGFYDGMIIQDRRADLEHIVIQIGRKLKIVPPINGGEHGRTNTSNHPKRTLPKRSGKQGCGL